MNKLMDITNILAHFPPGLKEAIQKDAPVQNFSKGTEILREGQYIQVIPIVLNGLVKVFTRFEDRELLLYYIKPAESCIMSFSSGIQHEPSQVFAITEEDSEILLLPVEKVNKWLKDYPDMNSLFFQQFRLRYSELLDTIHHILFNRLDQRLLEHLRAKTALKKENPIKISHQQLADELGTVREVVSRVLKKLETDGHVRQQGNRIMFLE